MSIMLYLDNAATTVRKPCSVYEAVIRAMVSGSGNAGRGANKLSIGSVKTIIEAQEAAATETPAAPAPEAKPAAA